MRLFRRHPKLPELGNDPTSHGVRQGLLEISDLVNKYENRKDLTPSEKIYNIAMKLRLNISYPPDQFTEMYQTMFEGRPEKMLKTEGRINAYQACLAYLKQNFGR